MSNLGLKAAFKEDKFNLKTIAVLFVLVDLSIVPIFIGLNIMVQFLYLLLYQVSLIFALMVGLRGQGKYKAMMLSLQTIARNRDLSIDEREKRLVNGIHHHCLELGYIYEERNEKYGLFKSTKNNLTGSNPVRVPKKTKKLGGERKVSLLIIDEVVWKQIGYALVSLWELFGPVIALFLAELMFHWMIILFLAGAWEIFGALVLFYIHYIFKLETVSNTQERKLAIEKELEELDS